MRRYTSFCLLLCMACACGDLSLSPDQDLEEVCQDDSAAITVEATAGGGEAVNQDLPVQGVASHADNIAIREILVAGIPARNDGFNFKSWSALVPLQTLKGLRVKDSDTVPLPITARDACGKEASASFEVRLGVPVQRLDMAADYPGDEMFLPADGTTALALTITAEPEAAGAQVKLEATEGASFAGVVEGSVTLSGDKKSPASASVLFTAKTEGLTVITASVDKATRILPVRVAGPPSLLPPSATLAPGQTITVTADSDGRVRDCQAAPAAGVSVTSGGRDLMATPAAVDESGDGNPDIKIAAAKDVAGQVSVTVTCRDPFGQFAVGTYVVAP